MYSWYLYDFANSGWSSSVTASFVGPFITYLCAGAALSTGGRVYPLGPGGPAILYDSYVQVLQIISVVVQIVAFLALGPIADYGGMRKAGMVFLATGCALLTLFFLICDPSIIKDPTAAYSVAAAIFILSNAMYGVSEICYYAFLPLLAREHRDLVKAHSNGADARALTTLKASLNKQLSSWGVTWGFMGSIGMAVGFCFDFPVILIWSYPPRREPRSLRRSAVCSQLSDA